MRLNLSKTLQIIGKIIYINIIIVAIAVCFLLIGCLFPQELIDKNIQESISVFEDEGQYPRIGDKEDSSMLDNFTDCLILMESSTMRIAELQSIFSNPLYFDVNPVAEFSNFIEKRDKTNPTGYYVRYWMGFRTPVRIMLVFMNYSQIRRFLSWVIFVLFIITSFFISSYIDIRTGVLFAISIIFVKPQVLCNSLQYSCCFILALLALFFIPIVIQKGKEIPFFLLLGMMTMYFDFYTSPLVVLGYPLIFMILLKTNEKPNVKLSLLSIVGWGIGYGTMWIMKLLCATLFTSVNGFSNGFHSFAARVGITKRSDLIEYYDIGKAFRALIRVALPDTLSRIIACITILCMIIVLIFCIIYNKLKHDQCVNYITLLFPIICTALWYMIAAQPTAIHAYFQYRNLSIVVFSGMMFYSLLVYPIKNKSKI